MSLIDQIVDVFRIKLTEVFTREADPTKNYMNQTILGCRWRAFWGITVAIHKSFWIMVKILALAIAKHREAKHGENKTRTITSLKRGMSNEQIEASEGVNVYWNA